jgi:hypothetical protein
MAKRRGGEQMGGSVLRAVNETAPENVEHPRKEKHREADSGRKPADVITLRAKPGIAIRKIAIYR